MALASATAENAAANAVAALAAYTSLHSASPATTGANEISGTGYARQATTWASASAGVAATSGGLSFTVPASTTVDYFGTWSAVSSGTYEIGGALSASVTFTTAGTLTIASGAETIGAS